MSEKHSGIEFQDIEGLILQNGLNNSHYCNTITKLKIDFFTTTSRKNIFKILNEHIVKYNEAPSFTILKQEILNLGADEQSIVQIAKDLTAIQSGFESNVDWLTEQTEVWCKQRAGVNAVNKARDILNGQNDELPETAILEIMEDALAFSLNDKMGHSYFSDVDHQFSYYHDESVRFPCDIEEVNAITQGGITSNTLNIFFAGINVGKTTWLINMASSFTLRGHNVLYISAEMSTEAIRERMDVRLLRCPSTNLRNLTKEEYKEKIKVLQEGTTGGLFIENYAPRSASALDIKRLIIDYRLKHGIKIDMLVVDYLGIIKSSRLPNSAMSNSNLYGTAVAEELRGLAKELDFPIWSAGQLNREGQDGVEDAGMKNVADSIGIMATCDLALVGVQPPQLEAESLIKVINLKNRYSNRTKIKDFVLGVNNDIQLIFSTEQGKQFTNGDSLDHLKKLTNDQDELMMVRKDNVKIPQTDLNSLDIPKNSNWDSSSDDELDFSLEDFQSLLK